MICKMQTHCLWLCGLMSKNEQINAWKIFPIWTNLWAIPIKSFLQIDPRRFTQNQQKLVFFFFTSHMISSTYASAPIKVFKFFRNLLYQYISTKLFIEVMIKMTTSCLHWGFIFFFLHFYPRKKKVFFVHEFFPGVDVGQCFLPLQLFSSKWDNQQSWYVYFLHFLGYFRPLHFPYQGIKKCFLGFWSSWTGIIFSHHQHH